MGNATEVPNWLKSVDNGKIGEARTKALLINKFWILERNVDIEGADFIIQRKIFGENLLDKEPPRLGYVQSKFCENNKTEIKIKKEYIQDTTGNLRTEFFLIIHSGYYEDERLYFFNAESIRRDFKEQESLFSLIFEKVILLVDAQVKSREYILSNIDHCLKVANFNRNRSFYNYLTTKSDESFDVDFEYTLPLANNYGDIRGAFLKAREKIKDLVRDMRYDIKTLEDAVVKTDPLEFYNILETGYLYFLEDYFYHNHEYINEELMSSLHLHKIKVSLLKKGNVLQNYLLSKEEILKYIREQISDETKCAKDNLTLKIVFDMEKVEILEIAEIEYIPRNSNKGNIGMSDIYSSEYVEDYFVIWFNMKSLMHSEHGKTQYPEYAMTRFEDSFFERKFGPKWYDEEE